MAETSLAWFITTSKATPNLLVISHPPLISAIFGLPNLLFLRPYFPPKLWLNDHFQLPTCMHQSLGLGDEKQWIKLEWPNNYNCQGPSQRVVQCWNWFCRNKYKNNWIKLKDEVGMAGSKSRQTRFVGIITFTIHPYACFSRLSCAYWCRLVRRCYPSVSVLDLHAGENIPYGSG